MVQHPFRIYASLWRRARVRTGSVSVEELEVELRRHLADFAHLDLRWRVIPWG